MVLALSLWSVVSATTTYSLKDLAVVVVRSETATCDLVAVVASRGRSFKRPYRHGRSFRHLVVVVVPRGRSFKD